MPANSSHTAAVADGHRRLDKRDTDFTSNWALTYMSVPPRTIVQKKDSEWLDVASEGFKYQRDTSQCMGQYVYVVDNKFDTEHVVSWPAGSGPFVLLWLLRGPEVLLCLYRLTSCRNLFKQALPLSSSSRRGNMERGTTTWLMTQSMRPRQRCSSPARRRASAATAR